MREAAQIRENLEAAPAGFRDLANRWFQPLTHVSSGGFPRKTDRCGQRGKRGSRNSQRFAVSHGAAQSVRRSFTEHRP